MSYVENLENHNNAVDVSFYDAILIEERNQGLCINPIVPSFHPFNLH